MDINTIRILFTVLAFLTFLGILYWAFGPSRRDRFERDAMLPFEESDSGETK